MSSLSVILLILCAAAQAEVRTISMEEVLQGAVSGPEVKAAQFQAGEARDHATSVWRRAYMPKLSGQMGYTHLLEDEALNLPPIGPLTIAPIPLGPDFVSGSVQLNQMLVDPASMFFKSEAAQELAQAEALRASRHSKETQGKAINYYLQILELRARRNALEKFVVNLRGRQTEIARLYGLGNVGESDVLKVKLGIDDATQSMREIQQKEAYLGQLLASVLGESATLSPKDLPEDIPLTPGIPSTIQAERREDIQGMDKQLNSITLSRQGAKAEYLPKVAASLQHYYSDTKLLTNANIDAVGVQLIWSIFDGGVDLANSQAAAEERLALEQKRILAVSTIKASYQDAINGMQVKRIEYQERRKALSEVKRVAEIEFKRLKVGRTTVNNLIDAEDVLKDRLEKTELSKISWYQAWFNHLLASGQDLKTP